MKLSGNDSNSADTVFSGRENFRITVFLPMIDHLLTALQRRLKAYDVVSDKFGFLSKISSVNGDQLRDVTERLVKTYPEDLNTSFPEEIVHFQEYMNERESDMRQSEREKITEGPLLHWECSKPLLRIYLSLLITNCSGERSFSALKRIKNYLLSTLKDEMLNHLASMHVESSVLRKLKFNNILDRFVDRLTRKIFKATYVCPYMFNFTVQYR